MLCDYFGNPWIGLFVKTNNEITFVPKDAREKFCADLSNSLKTEVASVSLAGSNLIGLYSVMNSKGIILPSIAEPSDVETFKKYGLNIYVSQERFNAHGNNLVVNDRFGLVSKAVSPHERAKIEDTLGVELLETTIAGYKTVGSVCTLTNKGFLLHYGSTQEELDRISRALKLSGEKGSINMGAGFVSLGLTANENGYIAGSKTSGFELGRVHSALGFL